MPNDNPYQGANGQWLAARTGCATASRVKDILDFRKDGKPGADRIRYMKEILAERLTGNAMTHYVTPAMQDGIDREPMARDLYEATTGNIVQLTGFVPHPQIEYAGASPDGLVGSDGLIEIKCATDVTHVDWLLAGVVPEQHKPQMTFQLACTGRKWCDFVAFNPNIKDERLRLMVRRFEPTQEELLAVEVAVAAFLAEIDQMFQQLTMKEAA